MTLPAVVAKSSAMPNKRKAGKSFVGGYVPSELKETLQQLAVHETDGDLKEILQRLLMEGLEHRGIKIERKHKTG